MTGLGKYPRTPYDAEPTHQEPLPLQRTATIIELIDQIALGDCDRDTLLNSLIQRVREINPVASRDHVLGLLRTKLPMGKTLYIYSKSRTDLPIISETKPTTYTGIVPDGPASQPPCSNTYSTEGTLVNTSRLGHNHRFGSGDDYVDKSIFLFHEGSAFTATDKAEWTASSGYKSLLGRLVFSNGVTGSAKYWAPN